ncbi:MAG: hypothetical protein EOR99_31445 [Mesorhizobium sp.]|uniref:hypothetical protein n=1 Tax=Mesorhizobium sp. TaxID=1871066 RepID=UPI000FE6D640|nr:hypothetical protein [Mesorhizobium sp.]RWM67953.1 MAG: hypothetical protein EOR81_33405 [Mesorhizobium sp.]RWN51866.1 MAG: hypothetical protein EOS00_33855 [Mesorhizobium sp.]RWN61084.1 MAG: hypothetical protein EOR99_31445 [Mesorhizobium sp.]TIO13810.1 MAG: hypothetical protein E5X86_27750 [Mesorhizobium sp.]TIR30065.1 MAG: hypothetical protein E5X35_24195 [Mesorhizobium sp.]
MAKVKEHITNAFATGVQVVARGERHGRGGLFFATPVLRAVTREMKIAPEDKSSWSRLRRASATERSRGLRPRFNQVLAIHRNVRVADLHVSKLITKSISLRTKFQTYRPRRFFGKILPSAHDGPPYRERSVCKHAAELLRGDNHDVAEKPSGFTTVDAYTGSESRLTSEPSQ